MEFCTLGPLRVSSGGRALDLGTPAQRALLAMLLTSPGTLVSDDRLVDGLWGEEPPASARHLVRVYVSRLRALLAETAGPERIVREGSGYALRVDPGELDAERFEAAVRDARALAAQEPGVAERILSAAMRLWRGAPYADLLEPPPVVHEQAAHLEDLHRDALQTWVDVRLRLGRHRELVPELARIAADQPYDEALHAQLMLALYRCYRQADALAAARELGARLRDDLGIDPSPEIRELYRDILLQAPHLSLESPEPPGNLPVRLTSFVGRTRELREVVALLGACRLVTLTGPGGIGKTRLALEAARQQRSRFPAGTWWVDLARVSEPETVLDQLAGAIGVAPVPGTSLLEAVVRALGRRRVLLVLDNCEHVASAVAELVGGLLSAATGPRVLATSRVPLRVEGEQLWRVPPMSLPNGGASADDVAASDAVHLFVERGRAVLPAFTLDGASGATIGEICRRLDGLSLAIEMAAARLAILSPEEIARLIDDRFVLLERSAVGRPARHRTMEAAIDASCALLAKRDQAVFERLAAFVGPFDLDAACAVGFGGEGPTARVLAALEALVEASMLNLERDGARTTYRLLETLREYGLARLRRRGIEDEVRLAHARHYLGLAGRAGALIGTPDVAPWMTRLTADYAELRHALGWSLAHEPRAITLRAAPALRELWYRRGDGREADRWTGLMLDGDLTGVPSSLLAEVHDAASYALVVADDYSAARSHADAAVQLAREGDSTQALLCGFWARATVALAMGDYATLRRDSLEALAICDRNGDRWGRGAFLANLGFVSMFGGGTLSEARLRFEEARPLLYGLGSFGSLVVTVLAPLSTIVLKQGDVEAAERYAMEAVELSSGTGWEASALVVLGEAFAARGDLASADAATTRALGVARNAGLENWFRMALRDLAGTTAARGALDEAAVLLGAARRNLPAYGFDPETWAPIEQRCRDGLGPARFDRLADEGFGLTHDEAVDRVHAAVPGSGDVAASGSGPA
jgi:predicted ATPase/DNA-binding winged helix-turn-helix (wHTH) protein